MTTGVAFLIIVLTTLSAFDLYNPIVLSLKNPFRRIEYAGTGVMSEKNLVIEAVENVIFLEFQEVEI